MASSGNGIKITPRQARAIEALMTESSVKKAAVKSGVGSRTLHRWLKEDPDFILAVNDAELTVLSDLNRRLLSLGEKATAALESVLDDKKTTVGHRLRASDVVLSNLLRVRELTDHEGRLLAIERIEKPEDEQE